MYSRTLDYISTGGLVVAATDEDEVHQLWAVMGSKENKRPTLFAHDVECKGCESKENKDPMVPRINKHNAKMIKYHRER